MASRAKHILKKIRKANMCTPGYTAQSRFNGYSGMWGYYLRPTTLPVVPLIVDSWRIYDSNFHLATEWYFFFVGLFSECTSLCLTICYGKQMSSCGASVNFDQMLRVSRNPIRTPACHVFSVYKHWQIPRKQAKHVTLEPAHLSSGLDVITAKGDRRPWYPTHRFPCCDLGLCLLHS